MTCGQSVLGRQALGWYLQAAEKGHAEAQTNAGSLHARGLGVPQDHSKAAEYYRLAAAQGHGRALVELRTLCFLGLGVPRDYVESRKVAATGCGSRAPSGAMATLHDVRTWSGC